MANYTATGGADPTTIIINENVCNSHVLCVDCGCPASNERKEQKNEELEALAYYAAHLLETRGPEFLTAAARKVGEGGHSSSRGQGDQVS